MTLEQRIAHLRMVGSLPSRIHQRPETQQRSIKRVTEETVREWKRLQKNGMTLADIARRFGRSRYCVQIHCRKFR